MRCNIYNSITRLVTENRLARSFSHMTLENLQQPANDNHNQDPVALDGGSTRLVGKCRHIGIFGPAVRDHAPVDVKVYLAVVGQKGGTVAESHLEPLSNAAWK